ncbi:MAG: hypothetical protein ACXABI_12680 [Candidatus Hodarchaeales archaeon]
MNSSVSILKGRKENPIAILIMEKNGVTLFSYKFQNRRVIEDQLISGFLSALNAFGAEMFCRTGIIDQIMFGEYILAMREIHEFIFCYIFEGSSDYMALRHLESFIHDIMNNSSAWEKLGEARVERIKLQYNPVFDHLIEANFQQGGLKRSD